MVGLIIALLITILAESIVLFFFLHKKHALGPILFGGISVNLITNPTLNILHPYSDLSGLVLAECGIILMEWLLYALVFELSWKESLLISVCANAASLSFFFMPALYGVVLDLNLGI